MLKVLRKLLFIMIFLVGASFATFAQSNTPPKDKKPEVPVGPKPTPKPPSDDNSNKPKKPTAEIAGMVQKITFI